MTNTSEIGHFYVAFEKYQLFLAFCSSKGLKSAQTTLVRRPGSASRIPRGSIIHILDKPNIDTQVELDVARLDRQCVFKFVNPFDKPVERERRCG